VGIRNARLLRFLNHPIERNNTITPEDIQVQEPAVADVHVPEPAVADVRLPEEQSIEVY